MLHFFFSHTRCNKGSNDSIAGVVTWLQAGQFINHCLIPNRSKQFISTAEWPDSLWALSSLPFSWYQGLFPQV